MFSTSVWPKPIGAVTRRAFSSARREIQFATSKARKVGLPILVTTNTIQTMTKQSRPRRRALSLEERVYLDLLRTCEALSRRVSEVLKSEDLSPTQYNVLRILPGAPDGLACGEIGNRMITRDPDITRLLDRLERRGLISRCRSAEDRRVVMARILPEGLRLLARLDERVEETHRRQLGHLGRGRLEKLAA